MLSLEILLASRAIRTIQIRLGAIWSPNREATSDRSPHCATDCTSRRWNTLPLWVQLSILTFTCCIREGQSSLVATQAPVRVNSRAYHCLAEYYDEVFGAFRIPTESARRKLLGPVLPTIHSACDLGCGTGTTAIELLRGGLSVDAIDFSPTMCEIARQKAHRLGLTLQVRCGDMRKFRLPHRVDLVICEGDAINHLPRRSDLIRVLTRVAHALNPGGHFFFDVNNLKGFRQYWKGDVCIETSNVLVVMRNGHDATARKAWSTIEFFVRSDGLWSRHRERVEEICWRPDEIRRALNDAGFDNVRKFDASPYYGPKSPVTPGCRSIYVARLKRVQSKSG
jgi:SAM-dependent methyltransferase